MKNPTSLDAFCFCEQDGLFMAWFITRGFILEVRMYLRGVCVSCSCGVWCQMKSCARSKASTCLVPKCQLGKYCHKN